MTFPPYLHLPLALFQRGCQLLILLQQSPPELGGQNEVRLYHTCTVAAAGTRGGRGESEGERRGERKEGVLQAGRREVGLPGGEHFFPAGRSHFQNIIPGSGNVIHSHSGGKKKKKKKKESLPVSCFPVGLIQINLINLLLCQTSFRC